MASYQTGQWTGTDWITRVVTLKRVPKRAPCNTLVYLWPSEGWAWANTVEPVEIATKLPAVSVDTNKIRVKLALLLLEYGKPAWVASEVGVTRANINWIQNNRNKDRWAYLPSVEQIREAINGGMKIRDMVSEYGIGLKALHTYLAAQGVSYEEMVRERDEHRRTVGLPALRGKGGSRKKASSDMATDHGIQAQSQARSALPTGHSPKGK